MRLTSFTDFGLRTLMRLAGTPDRSFTTDELAREFSISKHHLTKVVRQLSAEGYIVTQRGAGGGIRLGRQPVSIRVGDVVRHLEHRQALVECFQADGGTCTLTPKCRLKAKLSKAREAFLKELDRTTLADIAYRPQTTEAQ